MLRLFLLSCPTTHLFFFSVKFFQDSVRGRYGWKFNNSLLQDVDFPTKMKTHFQILNDDLNLLENPHLKWEYLKYEARKFSIAFSKNKILEESHLKVSKTLSI